MKSLDSTKIEIDTEYNLPNIIAIGASAGGLEALQLFLANLPVIEKTCIIIAQHLSPTHKSMLVQLLSRTTKLIVEEAVNQAKLESNKVYITPPDSEISVVDGIIHLKKPALPSGPKPSVDVLFTSLAAPGLNKVIAIILSGTGSDGTIGIKALSKIGAFIIAQEPETAKYDGMPLAAINTGLIETILPPEKMGEEIAEYLQNPSIKTFTEKLLETDSTTLNEILYLMGKRTNSDFSRYKTATICRRLEKRMAMLKINNIDKYLAYIKNDPAEIDIMFNMILIGVTTFFRDIEAFGALENYLHKIINAKTNNEPIRIWVAGCSTGEEAYSIAILLHRLLAERTTQFSIQIFATDIDDRAITFARKGKYPKTTLKELPESILEKYFVEKAEDYELIKSIRTMVLFSKHDVINNPPFLKLDLICCRNLLIYFNAELQRQVLPIFHYAINPEGYLFLGKSETIGGLTDLFTTIDAQYKIYQRKRGGSIHQLKFSAFKAQKRVAIKNEPIIIKSAMSVSDMVKETIFNSFEHPYVVINEAYDIQEVTGDVRLFLSLSTGSIQVNLLKMINPELKIEVRALLLKALKERVSVRSNIKKFEFYGVEHFVRIIAKPLIYSDLNEDLFIIVFEKLDIEDFITKGTGAHHKLIDNSRILELENELNTTKQHLQTYIEEIETSNEELQSLNEELQSTNEELQSTNEELETSNEELQSTNEEVQIAYVELKKINEELEHKDVLLNEIKANKIALLNNGLQGILLLDNKYTILDFNPYANTIFNKLKGKDIQTGSNIVELIPAGYIDAIISDLNRALNGETFVVKRSLKDVSNNNVWFSFTLSPVVVAPNQIQGVSFGLLDISKEEIAEFEIKQSEKKYKNLFNASPLAKWIYDSKTLRIVDVNEKMQEQFSYSKQELLQMYVYDLLDKSAYNTNQLKETIKPKNNLKTKESIAYITKNGSKIILETSESALLYNDIECTMTVGIDVTERELLRNIEVLELELMEKSIKNTANIDQLITDYLLGLENLIPGLYTNILRVKNNFIYNYLSPSLPKHLTDAFEGQKIGPASGSCGTAAFTGKTIIVDNIDQHPYWENYKHLALKEGIQACWSQPIFNSTGIVIATFSNYYKETKIPSHKELDRFKHTASLLGVVLENQFKTSELKITNERYHYATKASSDAIWDFDLNNKRLFWGDGFEYLFGFNIANHNENYEQWYNGLHPEDKDRVTKNVETYLKGDTKSWKHEYRFRKADGNYVYVTDKAYVLRDSDGKPIRVIGAIQDITVQKNQEIEKKLLSDISMYFNKEKTLSESLFKVIKHLTEFSDFETAEVWLPNADNTQLQLIEQYETAKPALKSNEAVKKIIHVQDDYLPTVIWNSKKSSYWDDNTTNLKSLKLANDYEAKAILGMPLHSNHELVGILMLYTSKQEIVQKPDKQIYLQLESYIGSEIKRKRIENELKQIFDFAPDLIGIMSKEGFIEKINPAGAKLLEYNQNELIGVPIKNLIHPEDIQIVLNEINKISKGNQGSNFECRYLSKSGSIKWLNWTATPSPNDHLIFSVAKDVTEQKNLQNLLNSANKLAKIGSWEIDLDNKKVFWSDITKEIREVAPDYKPNLDEGISYFKEGESRDTITLKVKECIEKGTPWDEELQILTFKGNLKWVRTIGKAEFKNNKCIRIYGSFQDINDRKIAELELTKKSFLLEAIANVITIFLQSEDWSLALETCFKITGESIGLDRIYFVEKHLSSANEPLFTKHYEWISNKSNSAEQEREWKNTPVEVFQELYEPLSKGETFASSVPQIPEGILKSSLTDSCTQSLIAIPIMIANKFYGFVGFEDCKDERTWSEDEVFFLQSITSNLSSAIQRSKSKIAIEKAFEEKNNILEAIGDGFLTINSLKQITYWNKSAEFTLAYKKEDVLGQDIGIIFDPVKEEEIYKLLNLALSSNEVHHFESSYNKLQIWLDVSIYPVKEGLSIYFKDISDKKRNEERIRQSNERFEKVSEATNDAIWDWDIIQNTLYWGDGYHKLFGYDTQIPIHINAWKDNVHPDDRQNAVEKIKHLLDQSENNNWTQEYRFRKNNGEYAFVIDRGVVIRNADGKPIRMIGAMSDITYRKETEENLKKLNEQLEVSSKELRISNDELEQFAYVASHDLQEPLRMVTSYLTLIEKKYEDVFDTKAQQYIHFAVDGAKRMRQIILDLLDFSRVGKHTDDKTLIPIDSVVHDIELLNRKLIDETNATINYKQLPIIKTYRTPIVQLFQNLIGNALKYRRNGIAPYITIEAKSVNNFWQFEISDNGIGVSKEYFDRIFILFQRLHNRDEYSGTGMGLAIVKKIVENLGGKVWLNSEIGKGSTFYFTIPKEDL